MTEAPVITLKPARLQDGRALKLAGLRRRYYAYDYAGMPVQWRDFVPYIDHIPARIGQKTYRVCYNPIESGDMDYLCAVEVTGQDSMPPELIGLDVPVTPYAMFTHEGHISTIGSTWMAIFEDGLKAAGVRYAGGPMIEVYGEDFNGKTGLGSVEIWIPARKT